jgi:MYXO-CTERM domain-containing protein
MDPTKPVPWRWLGMLGIVAGLAALRRRTRREAAVRVNGT